ncbi:NrtA/SsuA/CpmA family ABC transporter substrate-binding protein [Marispirochaeta aestuarii]|uniref:ABC transporter substrate-binding protein n=1 Tax=Marispirochaeta aestuarii TaxID=1963862 RepID=UPI0029C7A5F8|nr:NrtA/SsuA/CpmA family ABC transporter substrate-binding protein [Marispirochaeta aestuarii]
MRKIICAVLVMSVVSSICFARGEAEKPLEVINVSYVKSPFNLPQIIMKKRGMLDKAFAGEGIRIGYHEIESGSQQAQAMAAGSLDIGGVMNTTSVLLAAAAGNDVRIISGFSRPERLFAIVSADPSITGIRDLQGKKAGGPKGTVLHQLLAAAMESQGLDISDLEFLQMSIPQASTAMLAGHLDAALLAGSILIQARNSGAHVVVTAEGLVSPKLVICARGGFLESHPEAVDLYLQIHREALAWMKANKEEALRIGAEEQGISLDDARILYGWTHFTDRLIPEDLETMRDDIRFMLQNGMLTRETAPENCIAPFALP